MKTIALKNEGTDELIEQIQNHLSSPHQNERKVLLMADKAMQLIIKEKTKHINRVELLGDLKKEMQNKNFNLYQFVQSKLKNI